MSDDDEESLARRGLAAAELLEPGKLKERVKERIGEAAGDAALKGIAAVGRLAGRSPKRSPARARAAAEVDISAAIAQFDADDLKAFEDRLHEAAAKKALQKPEAKAPPKDDGRRLDLAELRRSFPPASHELALLIFNCVDLLEELSNDAEGTPPTEAELAKKEDLLLRITQLLAPRSEEALRSFVAHVVDTSRRYRAG